MFEVISIFRVHLLEDDDVEDFLAHDKTTIFENEKDFFFHKDCESLSQVDDLYENKVIRNLVREISRIVNEIVDITLKMRQSFRSLIWMRHRTN